MATEATDQQNLSIIAPREMMQNLIGERVTIILTNSTEFSGVLRGFDTYLNILLEDVNEYVNTSSGLRTSHIDKIYLSCNRVHTLVKGDIERPGA